MSSRFLRLALAGLLSAGLMAAATAAQTPDKLDGVKLVSAEQVKDLQAKGAPVIDTRVAAEFAEKTIKGATSVPYKEKSAKDAAFDPKQDSFDRIMFTNMRSSQTTHDLEIDR